jgi:hypothetical protein
VGSEPGSGLPDPAADPGPPSGLRGAVAYFLRGLAVPVLAFALVWLGTPSTARDQPVAPAPADGRPYFMPPAERARILDLVQDEPWARAELTRVEAAARKGDGYWAAFLYALRGEPADLGVARRWLLDHGRGGGDLGKRALESGPEFFRGGQPWLGDVYYRVDVRPLVAYDWVHAGLTEDERRTVEAGMRASAWFRMRAMDRWSQTPNLVFKPTYMVAMAGLVTGDPELLAWGFHRKPWSTRGGYFPVQDLMLRDGGPWAEAPIYPVAHQTLLLMARMSRYLGLLDGRDWFGTLRPFGGSVRGLMDFYLDTAYPVERTGLGTGQVRVATYGDGATSAGGDLFLVNPAGPGLHLHEELAEAYAASGDSRYAAFLGLLPGYAPDLVHRRPLPPAAELPPAPSRVWPRFGLAMLRSDESPGYWTGGRAIAVLQVMTQGYGHDHRDKLGITLHGAGRLLYPDYNAVQYENPAVGWTRNSVAHSTLVVDEADTRDAPPTGIRHEFTPGVKFLATSVSGLFDGVDQTRVLVLTGEYLLDLVHAASPVPRTYDYLLHSFGEPRPVSPGRFAPTDALVRRYWTLREPRALATGAQWALDFVLDGAAARRREAHDREWHAAQKKPAPPVRYGPEWYAHTAAVRVTMAAEPDTLVAHGRGVHELSMLVARRSGRRDTVFVAAHEPFANADRPGIRAVTTLARSRDAIVVRVDADGFTDYVAATFGPQAGSPERALVAAGGLAAFAFRGWAHLRLTPDGQARAWGHWTGLRLPHPPGALTVRGEAVAPRPGESGLAFGAIPAATDLALAVDPKPPVSVSVAPAVARLGERGRRVVTFSLRNVLDRPVSGHLELELPSGLSLEPPRPPFGPLAPGEAATVTATVVARGARPGRVLAPYRVYSRVAGAGPAVRSAALALPVAVGPVLAPVYQHPAPAFYRVDAPGFTAEVDMANGLWRHLADDDDTVRLDGSPLFTLSDGQRDLLTPGNLHASTWPTEAPAHVKAHAYDQVRYDLQFLEDRVVVTVDRDWTRFPVAHVTVPGHWRSPEGPATWARVVTERGTSGGRARVAAAELAFPGGRWSLCFEFVPAQEVTFSGAGLAFALDVLAGDRWGIGFCQRGALDAWRR